jgi:ABC-type sugar transport system ATPase subunit
MTSNQKIGWFVDDLTISIESKPLLIVGKVSLDLTSKIVGIVGGNGSGKSTLIKVLTGYAAGPHIQWVGSVRIACSHQIETLNKSDSSKRLRNLGVFYITQELPESRPFKRKDILIAGLQPSFFRLFFPISYQEQAYLIKETARRLFVEDLLVGTDGEVICNNFRLVSLIRLIQLWSKRRNAILVLDEATAGLKEDVALNLLREIHKIALENTSGVLLVSHQESEMDLCDDIYQVHRGYLVPIDAQSEPIKTSEIVTISGDSGELVMTLSAPQISNKIINVYSQQWKKISINGFERQSLLFNELVGLSESNEIVKKLDLGSIELADKNTAFRRKAGLGYVPADRLSTALHPGLTVRESFQLMEKVDDPLVKKLNLHSELETKVSDLSGGFKQKVVLVRELSQQPKVLVCERLYRGLDIGSIKVVDEYLKDYLENGGAILEVI